MKQVCLSRIEIRMLFPALLLMKFESQFCKFICPWNLISDFTGMIGTVVDVLSSLLVLSYYEVLSNVRGRNN